nr:hypothetical protein HmN_001010900 [Hymenolepis microstoma]
MSPNFAHSANSFLIFPSVRTPTSTKHHYSNPTHPNTPIHGNSNKKGNFHSAKTLRSVILPNLAYLANSSPFFPPSPPPHPLKRTYRLRFLASRMAALACAALIPLIPTPKVVLTPTCYLLNKRYRIPSASNIRVVVARQNSGVDGGVDSGSTTTSSISSCRSSSSSGSSCSSSERVQ